MGTESSFRRLVRRRLSYKERQLRPMLLASQVLSTLRWRCQLCFSTISTGNLEGEGDGDGGGDGGWKMSLRVLPSRDARRQWLLRCILQQIIWWMR